MACEAQEDGTGRWQVVLGVWQPMPGKLFVELLCAHLQEEMLPGPTLGPRRAWKLGPMLLVAAPAAPGGWVSCPPAVATATESDQISPLHREGTQCPFPGHTVAEVLTPEPPPILVLDPAQRPEFEPVPSDWAGRNPSETEATQAGSRHGVSLSPSWPPGCRLGTLCRALEGTDLATEAVAGPKGCRTAAPRCWTSPTHPQRL